LTLSNRGHIISQALTEETYLPEDTSQLVAVHEFLAAHDLKHGSMPAAPYMLVGAEKGDKVDLPKELHRVLVQVVESLQAGLAVTVAPQTMRLTTQQAADLLGISRPTLVGLVESGAIPIERQSSLRKLMLRDVLVYRAKRKAAQYEALDATTKTGTSPPRRRCAACVKRAGRSS
jgi:excisionase family DNA binding protein